MDKNIPLGKPTEYRFDYDAALLFPVARSSTREALEIGATLPFHGVDVWTAYELSWLNMNGLPQAAIAEITFACESTYLIESKSLKLYLNGFNQSRFADAQTVQQCIVQDLSAACGGKVTLRLLPADTYPVVAEPDFICLEQLCPDVDCTVYQPDAGLLRTAEEITTQRWCSHLFRSLCPVTGQPDWASVYIECTGKHLLPDHLLAYLVSYRQHQGFHEQCVEMLFQDILAATSAEQLTVSARFVRRGGLDINPVRSTLAMPLFPGRQARQ